MSRDCILGAEGGAFNQCTLQICTYNLINAGPLLYLPYFFRPAGNRLRLYFAVGSANVRNVVVELSLFSFLLPESIGSSAMILRFRHLQIVTVGCVQAGMTCPLFNYVSGITCSPVSNAAFA